MGDTRLVMEKNQQAGPGLTLSVPQSKNTQISVRVALFSKEAAGSMSCCHGKFQLPFSGEAA